jgi:hypothetical protein
MGFNIGSALLGGITGFLETREMRHLVRWMRKTKRFKSRCTRSKCAIRNKCKCSRRRSTR